MANILTRIVRRAFRLDRSEKRSAASTLSNPADWVLRLLGSSSSTGLQVTKDNALTVTALWRAIDILSGVTAALPFKVHREFQGRVDVANAHPVNQLLRYHDNSDMTAFSFMYSMMANAILFGAAAAEIIRDERGQPIQLRLLKGQIDIWEDSEGNRYVNDWETATRTAIPIGDCVFIPGILIQDGIRGKTIYAVFREVFGESMAMQQFGNRFYANGAFPTGVLESDKKISPEGIQRLREGFSSQFGGLENVGKTPVLQDGIEYKPIQNNLRDAQFTESRRLNVGDISRITGVPPHMLGDLERATFSNIEHQNQEFITYTLNPWLVRIEQEFNKKLFVRRERGEYYTKFNIEAMLRGDMQSQAEYFLKMVQMGALSPNEVRRLTNQNPAEGGDQKYIMSNLMKLGQTPISDEQTNG